MTTILFVLATLAALAVVGHFATPAALRTTTRNPLALVRRGTSSTLAAGRMSWSARQTIA